MRRKTSLHGAHAVRAAAGLALVALAACRPAAVKHLAEAQRQAFAKDPVKAVASYEKALLALGRDESDESRRVRIRALRGAGDACYLDLRDYKRAVDFYRQLAEAYPEAPDTFQARVNLFEILRNRFGDRRGALAELASLVQSFPVHDEIDRYQFQAANEYFDLGDFQQARIEVKTLLDRYPKSPYAPDAQLLIGATFVFENRRMDAINAYLMLIARWPDHPLVPRARLEIGKVYADGGDYDRAQEMMLLALRDHPEPQRVQGELLRLRKRLALTRPADVNDRAAVWDRDYAARRER